ncbi:MAG TPA: hypothetical protein VM582_08030, partial [Candidatus Thermoplasmatota archaeon]|nr:hypothetical protein [Candidatus Thermoplasmatota archaeon]
ERALRLVALAARAQPTPRHWVYLDAERTHELHAQVALAPHEALLVTTEFPAGSRDPAEVVRAQARVLPGPRGGGLSRGLVKYPRARGPRDVARPSL